MARGRRSVRAIARAHLQIHVIVEVAIIRGRHRVDE